MLQRIDLRRTLQAEYHLEPSSEYDVWRAAKVTIVEPPNERPRKAGQSVARLESRPAHTSEKCSRLRTRNRSAASTRVVAEVSVISRQAERPTD